MFSNSSSWQTFIDEGHRFYMTAANGSAKRAEVFTPDILYNLISMAIEKFIMGFLLYHNRMPDNHTLEDLIVALQKVEDVGEDLYNRVLNMDRFQEICSVFTYQRKTPGSEDIAEMLDVGRLIQAFVGDRLPLPSDSPKTSAVN